MTTYRYDEVSYHARKVGLSAKCDKPATRQRKFTNTINPFNRNPDGSVRTRSEVWENVKRLGHEWEAEPVRHARCES